MPLFTDTPEAPSLPQQDVVQAFKPGFKSAVVDTRYAPQSDQIAYIDGSPWIVDYYSQVLDANNELLGQDTSLPAPLQQYKRIWSLELKVIQDLSQISVEASTSEFTLQGSANVYPFLIPQVGDMFRAGIADGREGLFKVIRVEPRQLFAEAAHVIEYQLIADNDGLRIGDLQKKTIATYYFVKDFLLNLQNPLLEEADYHASRSLEGFFYDLTYYYFTQYFSRELMTIVVPEQNSYMYDHGLTSFVKAIMNSFDDVHIQSIRQLNVGDDGAIKSPSLWDMFDRRDPKMLKYIYKTTGLVNRQAFHHSGMMAGMRYTGVEWVVYPLKFRRNVDFQQGRECDKPVMADNIVSTMPSYVPPPPPQDGQIAPLPAIKPVNMLDGYVLSQAFYNRDVPNCSMLEKLLLDYLDFKIISAVDILHLCEGTDEWGEVEKFYYYPLLLLLIRYNIRRL